MDRLRDVYVDLLLDRGANDEAITVRHKLFDTHPTQTNYLALRRTAKRTGDWPGLRSTAIGRLRDKVNTNPVFADHMIGIVLDEDDLDIPVPCLSCSGSSSSSSANPRTRQT